MVKEGGGGVGDCKEFFHLEEVPICNTRTQEEHQSELRGEVEY